MLLDQCGDLARKCSADIPRTLTVQRVGPARGVGATWTRAIETQTTFHVGHRAQRSISHALFNENGAFCVRANEMERKASGSTWQEKKRKREEEICQAANEAGFEIFM